MQYVLMLLLGCSNTDEVVSDIIIHEDNYQWVCVDKIDASIIDFTVQHCYPEPDNVKAELTLNNGLLYDVELLEVHECLWEAQQVMIDEVCIQITDVTIIAKID
jgi:hypothetical protein